MTEIETDYLVVGAGAVGMAFADVILTETKARVAIVDRRARPGGHWCDAYPFVTLHQPSAFYGVASRELSKGRADADGLGDLAAGAEIVAYYDEALRQGFLPTGRVDWLPMTDHLGEGRLRSRLTGRETQVRARVLVDATWLQTAIPATHPPAYAVAPGARLIPINDLAKVAAPPAGFTVVGGGKTGIDACLWLLGQGVDPDAIRWIMPRDGWLLDRRNTQPTRGFFHVSMGAQAAQFEAIAAATSIDDMFDRLEASGWFLRIDPAVRPKMFHGATVSRKELEALRRIRNVVRLGRVRRIGPDRIVLEQGEIPTGPDILHVDCSASAITNAAMRPIFEPGRITPQTVRSYQPVFSAAFIAHVEAAYSTDAEKNRFCGLVPLPNHDTDFLRFTAAFMRNQQLWSQTPELRAWLIGCRLDGFSRLVAGLTEADVAEKAILRRIRDAAPAAMAKLLGFLAELDRAG